MAKIEKFEDIDAWKEARALTNMIYKVSEEGQFLKDFSLKNQARSASVSVMSNIAEGFDRETNKEFIQFLVIATSFDFRGEKPPLCSLRSRIYRSRGVW